MLENTYARKKKIWEESEGGSDSIISPWTTLPTTQNWKDLPHITCCCKKNSRKKSESESQALCCNL